MISELTTDSLLFMISELTTDSLLFMISELTTDSSWFQSWPLTHCCSWFQSWPLTHCYSWFQSNQHRPAGDSEWRVGDDRRGVCSLCPHVGPADRGTSLAQGGTGSVHWGWGRSRRRGAGEGEGRRGWRGGGGVGGEKRVIEERREGKSYMVSTKLVRLLAVSPCWTSWPVNAFDPRRNWVSTLEEEKRMEERKEQRRKD